MSEEEKKAIEEVELIIGAFYDFPNPISIELRDSDVNYFKTVLNIIENQQKELNNIKEENGKLRVELEQEKEIDKEIAIKNHKIKEESNAYGEEIIRLDNELEKEKEKNTELRIQISAREQVCEELQKQIEEYKIILKRQEQLEQETENLMKQGWL